MKEIYKALASFQDECPSFVKDTDGYGYKYTTLPTIASIIRPILRKYGLMVRQESFNGETSTGEVLIGVKSYLIHIDTQQELTSELLMPLTEIAKMNLYQVAGSAITYMRRYDLSNLLDLQSEKDDDVGGGKTMKRVAKRVIPKEVTKPKVKPLLTPASDKWASAKAWIDKGGTTAKITNNYTISDEHLKLLTVK